MKAARLFDKSYVIILVAFVASACLVAGMFGQARGVLRQRSHGTCRQRKRLPWDAQICGYVGRRVKNRFAV
jgi:putative effector of murein hydrolase LrgA (UPF0299 family)